MDPRNLGTHLAWCRKMSECRRFHDIDRDDVLSLAMEAAWKALACPIVEQILPTRNMIFQRRISDLRRHVNTRKKVPRPGRIFSWNDAGEEGAMPDPSLDDPADTLCALEAFEPIVKFYNEHGYPPADPCARCGTIGGLVRHDSTGPRRTEGLCHKCYQAMLRSRRRAGGPS